VKYFLLFRGDLVAQVPDLIHGYVLMKQEYKKRWPRAIYGPQEASAKGFSLEGKTELTPEEGRELRRLLDRNGDGGGEFRRSVGQVVHAEQLWSGVK